MLGRGLAAALAFYFMLRTAVSLAAFLPSKLVDAVPATALNTPDGLAFLRSFKTTRELTNSSCENIQGAKSHGWQLANGDEVVDQFQRMYDENLLYCRPCWALPKSQCNNTITWCDLGLRDASGQDTHTGVVGTPRIDQGIGLFANASARYQCSGAAGQCRRSPPGRP